MLAVVQGRLNEIELKWEDEDCVCVVIVSEGYPDAYETGKKIAGITSAREADNILIFHSGTKRHNGDFVTAGGRVLNVVGCGRGIFGALSKTYNAVDKIFFDKMYYRKDIGHRAARVLR